MRCTFYSLSLIAGGLNLTLLAASSFGSNRLTQEEFQEKILASAPIPHIAVPFSPESTLPHDVRVNILSFLNSQKELLRIGTVSKSWRRAVIKVWEERWLDLSSKHLTEADYKLLAGGIFPRLRLNMVGINEEGMNILATCSHLQALELRNNNLRATESLIKLLSLPHLSHIDLYNNNISDEGAKAIADALKQNKTLNTIYLWNDRIGTEGAKAIAEALSQNTTLITVGLSWNGIGAEGTKAIVEALSQNTTLTKVYLGYNSICDEDRKALEVIKRSRPSLTIKY